MKKGKPHKSKNRMKSREQIPQMPTKYFMNLLYLGISKLFRPHILYISIYMKRHMCNIVKLGMTRKDNIEIQFISLLFWMSGDIF